MNIEELPTATTEVFTVVHANHRAEDIRKCVSFKLESGGTRNPLYDKDQPNGESEWVQAHPFMNRLLEEGWKVASICWVRDDGSVNYGHEPAVHHVLTVIMVKLDPQ